MMEMVPLDFCFKIRQQQILGKRVDVKTLCCNHVPLISREYRPESTEVQDAPQHRFEEIGSGDCGVDAAIEDKRGNMTDAAVFSLLQREQPTGIKDIQTPTPH
jgi:hypothetical protein